MADITALFITLNKMPERWKEYQLRILLDALGDIPIISVSPTPMNLGKNLIDTDVPCYSNIYRQMLKAARASGTKYVAMVEDDVLYHKSHFTDFRPKDDEFAYNRHRWSLFTWGEPVFSLRNRVSNCSMIAPRSLLIETLDEWFTKYPNPRDDKIGECGRAKVCRRMGVTIRKQVDFESKIGLIHLNHPQGTEDKQQKQWKAHAKTRAYDIPHWGRPEGILQYYNTSS